MGRDKNLAPVTEVDVTPTLAAEIVRAHDAVCRAVQSGVEHARRAGNLLIEAKAGVEHGTWLDWLAAHCPTVPERTAQAYMRIARAWPTLEAKAPRVADLPMRQVLALLAERTTDAAEHHLAPVDPTSLWRDVTNLRRLMADEEQEAKHITAELQMLSSALEASDVTVERAAAIHRRVDAIWRSAVERQLRWLETLGHLLHECEAIGWADVMRDLWAHPEAIPEFQRMCKARMVELEGADHEQHA